MSLPEEESDLSFHHVSFAYDTARPILDDLDFTTPAGTTTAIVGPTGAGKSTIIRLLFRFYDLDAGSILIGGYDIRNISQQSLRQSIGIVPQDTVLFNQSVYDNIAYGHIDATPSEVEDAARKAELHEFIMSLPQAYQTIVGERGLKLSGGERQRVAIARTIIKNPRILVFDEASSALDSATEKEIQKNLDEISKDRTTIIIAHRLSTVTHADQILVLDQGRIVEKGQHKQLLKEKGLYARLWEKQSARSSVSLSAPNTSPESRKKTAKE